MKFVVIFVVVKQVEWDGCEVENGVYMWEQDFVCLDKGMLLLMFGNVYMILVNYKVWQGVIEQDDFGGCVMKCKVLLFW